MNKIRPHLRKFFEVKDLNAERYGGGEPPMKPLWDKPENGIKDKKPSRSGHSKREGS